MHRVTRWLDRGRAAVDTSSLDPVKEAQNMEIALRAAELIMDDDIPGAERQLAIGDSAFHKLAIGTLSFMKAALGFEQDAMKEASDLLAEAESSAYTFQQKVMHDTQQANSGIYDNGSEFALCQAEAQMMTAVVGMLNESLTDSLKGFYKMRKAYQTLDSLARMEANFMKTRGMQSLQTSRNVSKESVKSNTATGLSATKQLVVPHTSSHLKTAATPEDNADESDDSDEFYEPDEVPESNAVTRQYQGHLDISNTSSTEAKMQHLTVSDANTRQLDGTSPVASGATSPALPSGAATPTLSVPPGTSSTLLTVDADSDIFTSSLDIFIHSGVNLMSGLINLLLSVIPPVFSRLLSVVGFRGDRERGLKMLWQASKFSNINGGLAALIIFGWYNGVVGFCDIISESDPNVPDDVNGYPMDRLHSLLAVMRQRYPNSLFWKLEEARTYSSTRKLDKSLEIILHAPKANMRQLEALHMFELSIDAMNAQRYELCAESFIKCVELNGWSQALYYYTAGAAYLQLYRDLKGSSESEKAEKFRKLAEKNFKEAPIHVGKKKMMGRQLPFDVYVARKINKWNERAAAWGCSFIDATGLAPLDEVIMLWNGYKKMNRQQLNKSLANLEWCEKNSQYWAQESTNEKIIQATLRAIVYRNLRDHEKAKDLLREHVLPLDANALKGHLNDEWMGAVGNYEMAANHWMERKEYISRYGATIDGLEKDSEVVHAADIAADAPLVAAAKQHIEKAKGWGGYELDARIGIKVTAGYAAITRWEAKHKEFMI